jgi:hypothetical protein
MIRLLDHRYKFLHRSDIDLQGIYQLGIHPKVETFAPHVFFFVNEFTQSLLKVEDNIQNQSMSFLFEEVT